MSAANRPPVRLGPGGQIKYTRKQIQDELAERFPQVSRSQREKAASAASSYCHARPDTNAMEHAIKVLTRNTRRVSYRNRFDADVDHGNSPALDAIANLDAGVA